MGHKFINAKINSKNFVIHRKIRAGFKYNALYNNDTIQNGIFQRVLENFTSLNQ